MTVININTNCDESVVRIEVQIGYGKTAIRYAIYDAHLGYWRGKSALTRYDAWTRDLTRRAVFVSRADALRALTAIDEWRRDHEEAADTEAYRDVIAA